MLALNGSGEVERTVVVAVIAVLVMQVAID